MFVVDKAYRFGDHVIPDFNFALNFHIALDQAVKDELIAFYGDVKDDLTPDDIDDLMVAMRAKAERNKKKKSGV